MQSLVSREDTGKNHRIVPVQMESIHVLVACPCGSFPLYTFHPCVLGARLSGKPEAVRELLERSKMGLVQYLLYKQ
jgi:hypothetical protein